MGANATLSIDILARIDSLSANLKKAQSQFEAFGKNIDKATNKLSSIVTSNLSGIFSTAAIVGFGKAVIDVTAEFQKYNAVLGNTLNSTALASLKMQEIQDFAAKTPFAVNELTASFVKLANGGFKPTGQQMTYLGDLASSTGKSFDQLAEAILDAQSGEFERLKEFGIRAKDAGDSVIFTYKGVQTQVEKTSGSIRDYITNLGSAQGVSGSMAKISETLGGKISNLGDSWDQMLLSVGNNSTGVFNNALNALNKMLQGIIRFNKEVELVNKYNLDHNEQGAFGFNTEIGRKINRAINPFADKGSTDIEKGVFIIGEAANEFNEFTSKTLASAKSVEDFKKALKGLEQLDSKLLSDPFIDKIKSFTVIQGVQKAINDEFQKSAQAINDAQANFSDIKPDANFGKGLKGAADEIKDVYKDLAIAIKQNSVEFGATFNEQRIADIDAYQAAIKSLIANGLSPASEAVKKLILEQERLAVLVRGKDLAPVNGNVKVNPKGLQYKEAQVSFPQAKKSVSVVMSDAEAQVKEFTSVINDLILSSIGSTIANIATEIGKLFSGEGGSIGKVILEGMSTFLSAFGDQLIKFGLAAKAFAGLKAALFANPITSIGAAIGVIAAGLALKVASGAIGNLMNGSKSKSNTPRPFANGGIISGPTLGLMGEYAGASNNPEVVAPLNKLRDLLPQGQSNVNIVGSMGISMRELVIKFRQEEKLMGRTI